VGEMKSLAAIVYVLMWLERVSGVPFGGWGPGEGFGHLGRDPPPDNPNADFGYDFFGTTKNRFNYSAVVMSHKEPRSMRDPIFVSVAAKVAPSHRHYHGPSSRKQFRNSKTLQNENKGLRKGKKSYTGTRNSGLIPKSGRSKTVKQLHQTKKSRGQKSVSHANKVKPQRSKEGRVKAKKSLEKTVKSRKSLQSKLNASDLWRLNRSSHQFTRTMGNKSKNFKSELKRTERRHQDKRIGKKKSRGRGRGGGRSPNRRNRG